MTYCILEKLQNYNELPIFTPKELIPSKLPSTSEIILETGNYPRIPNTAGVGLHCIQKIKKCLSFS